MWTFLNRLQKNLIWAIPIAMIVGIVFGVWFDTTPLKHIIIPVTFIMVYPMMVTLNVKSVFSGRDVWLQLFTQLVNFVVIPLIAFLIGRLLLVGPDPKFALWAVGLFLIGVLPTSGMTISWTGFARGNKEAATKMVLFGLVIGSLAAPVYTKFFMGAVVDVHMGHMFQQIALFVFLPMAAGLLTQTILKRRFGLQVWNERLKPRFPPFSALGVVLIAFVAMSLKARGIVAHPTDILRILLPLLVFYLVSYLLLTLAGRLFFHRDDAVAMVYGVVMRDLSIALAIAMTAFGREGTTIALLIALAYVIQIQSAAWYIKLVGFFFGEPATKADRERVSATTPGATETLPTACKLPAFNRILYATDLSDTARYALGHACRLGQTSGGTVTVLHVVHNLLDDWSSGAGIDLDERSGESQRQVLNQAAVDQAREAIRDRIRHIHRQVEAETGGCPLSAENVVIQVGDPVQQILHTSREGKYDLVVMGTHGHGRIGRALIGSVAEAVIRGCEKPVMVVRLPDGVSP
jgi:arsenite transporter